MRDECGFTLIETLLALVLLILVASAIYSLYFFGVSAWRKGIEQMDYQQNLRAAADLIDRELRFAGWVEIPQSGEICYKLLGDLHYEDPRYHRRFRLSGEQLLMEEKHQKKTNACNVVAMTIKEISFDLDQNNNISINIIAGGAGDTVTLTNSVSPRNLRN